MSDTIFQKGRHYSPDIEAAVLGACLLEKTAFGRIRDYLKAEYFYSDGNKIVFETLAEMFDQFRAADLLTVPFAIMNNGIKDFEGKNVPYYCTMLTDQVVSAAHLEEHAQLIRYMWTQRELLKLTRGGIDLDADLMTNLDTVRNAVQAMMPTALRKDWIRADELVMSLVRHQTEMQTNPDSIVRTYIDALDEKNGGFFQGDLVIIGARPGAGKSAFMGQMAKNMSMAGKKVGIISLEMSNVQIAARIASMMSEVEFNKVFRGLITDQTEQRKFHNTLSQMSDLPLYITDQTDVTAHDIRAKADRLKNKHGIDVLFVDYLQLVSAEQSRNKTRENVIAEISRGLKVMAMDLGIPVIVLCQLNRESVKRQGAARYPQLSDLRESGSLEQDADVVMFVHRDILHGIEVDENNNSTADQADLIVRKWRNQDSNLHVKMKFDGPRMTFRYAPGTAVKHIAPEGLHDEPKLPFKDKDDPF